MATRPASQTHLDSGQRVFANLNYIYFTPWKTDGSEIGTTTYDLTSIVGDTTSVEQNDNEINELPHEFSKEPLYENVNLGTRTFTTECIDFQKSVLTALFGWQAEGEHVFAPDDYKDLYCAIEMGFNSTNDIVVLPKVKLNSKAVLSSMKTDASRATITGTSYAAYITAGGAAHKTDMAVLKAPDSGTLTYDISATED